MFKKLLIAMLAVVVGVGVVSGTRLGSHIRMKWTKAQDWAKEQVSLESEIERLKMEVANLKQTDDRYYDQVARQKQQVTKLRAKIDKARTALATQETYIREMRQALASDAQFVAYKGTRYNRAVVESDVRKEAILFMGDEKLLKQDEANLAVLEETLGANRTKLLGLAGQRKEMEAQLLVLERELAQQRLKEQSTVILEDGRYGKVNKEIDELRDRVNLQKTRAALRGEAHPGSIRAQEERKAEGNKVDQAIEERFGKLETTSKKLTD